jgi:hypothetical protein
MPKMANGEGWDGPAINAKIDRAHHSLIRELSKDAWRPPNLLDDDYIADLIRRALWNKKWTFGDTLKNKWRREHI